MIKILFWDLDITIEENRFITKIYHKVDDFDFEVVSFPFPTSIGSLSRQELSLRFVYWLSRL